MIPQQRRIIGHGKRRVLHEAPPSFSYLAYEVARYGVLVSVAMAVAEPAGVVCEYSFHSRELPVTEAVICVFGRTISEPPMKQAPVPPSSVASMDWPVTLSNVRKRWQFRVGLSISPTAVPRWPDRKVIVIA